jgi:hypothetical protein
VRCENNSLAGAAVAAAAAPLRVARFNWVALLLVLYGDKGREREFDAVK